MKFDDRSDRIGSFRRNIKNTSIEIFDRNDSGWARRRIGRRRRRRRRRIKSNNDNQIQGGEEEEQGKKK